MSRWVSADNEAAVESGNFRGCFLAEFEFTSGTVRINDGGHDVVHNGNTYFGTGGFGEFDEVREDTDGVAYGVRFGLGVDSGIVATMRTEKYQGKPARLYVALFDENWQLIDDPELIWSGYMDTLKVSTKGRQAAIVLTCEHRIRQAAPNGRFADAEQRSQYSGDKFFEYVHLVAGYTSNWGGKSSSWNYQPGGGYRPG